MSLLLDARPHSIAVRKAITAALAPDWSAYDYGKVPGANGNPGELPAIFALVSVERRPNVNLRMSAQSARVGWRLSVECVGRTVAEAAWAMNRVSLAVNEQALTIGSQLTSPIQFESDQAPAPDDDQYAGRSFWVYSH